MTTPPGWRVLVHETLPSTSDLVRQLAEAGEPEGLAVLAHRQSSGRGSHGRLWQSPPGNLFLSLLLRPTGPARQAGLWGLLAAVAIAEVAAAHIPDAGRLGLKWPNDVLLDDAKLAGVLTEAAGHAGGGLAWLCLGLGVNLATAPDVPDRATACLGPAAPPPRTFADALLARVDAWRHRVLVEGWGPLRHAWLERGPALGTTVSLRRPDGVRAGRFAGLAEDGALLLATGDRVHAFAVGET